MKIYCSKEKLKEYIIQADSITGKNINLPILNSILLTTEDKFLKIKSTNLDLGIEFNLPVKIEKHGSVVVSGDILSKVLCGLFGEENITLELINDNLVISTKKHTILIKSYSPKDFPIIPKIKKNTSIDISIEKFILGLKSVSYSSTISDIKPEISSVYIYTSNNKIIFVATDSFRLAEKNIISNKITEFQNIIIPLKNVNEIIKIFNNNNNIKNIKISFDQNQIMFSTDGIYVISRTINSIYPDYKQIIPTDFTTEIIVFKKDIENVLKLINVFIDEFNKVNIKTNIINKTLELNSKNINIGENTTIISTIIKGEEIDIDFNSKYLLDGLQSINQDSVVLKYNSTQNILIIQGVLDNSFIYLVKPINK